MSSEQPHNPEFSANASTSSIITAFHVEHLFGKYTYDVDMQKAGNRFSILYGPNGCGKTTILRMIFHLLSPADNEGHRSALASIPFKSAKLFLEPDVKITVSRDGRVNDRAYTLSWTTGRKKPRVAKLESDAHGAVDGPHLPLYLDFLRELKIGISYLNDRRDFRLSSERREGEPRIVRRLRSGEIVTYSREFDELETAEDTSLHDEVSNAPALRRAISRFQSWAAKESRQTAGIGEANANLIYAEILKSIATSSKREKLDPSRGGKESVITELEKLEADSQGFERLGISPRFRADGMIEVVRSVHPTYAGLVLKILKPYLDGVRVKMQAQQRLKQVLQIFTDTLNSFFVDKSIEFDVNSGIRIVLDGGRGDISPYYLSSGEQHLLLLFCNLVSSRSGKSVLLIDEPEISLNPKWQRSLVSAMNQLVADSNTQLLLATHSMDILARYPKNVLELVGL